MVDGGLWVIPLLVVLLGVLGYGTAAYSSALRSRQAGTSWVGAFGSPGREVARLLLGQRNIVPGSDVLLARIGTALLPLAAIMAALVLPLGTRAITDMSVGVVWFNAMEVFSWVAVWMVGWGSNSAWGLIGANRFLAQGLAYELPQMFSLIAVGVGAGSLNVSEIAAAQGTLWYAVSMPVAFLMFLISAMAFAFWGPFSQAIASDAAGGAAAQLSGVDRLVFLVGRYLMLTVASAMAVPLFLGGDAGPLLPGWAWILIKTVLLLAIMVWARHRLPTIRIERFTELSWVILMPLTLLQALVVSIFVLVGWM
jgi:NADH-quinone oxidoreductase subunit H